MTGDPGEISTTMHSPGVMTNHKREVPAVTQSLESATYVIQQGYVSTIESSFEGTTQNGYDSNRDNTSDKTLLDTPTIMYSSTFDKISNDTTQQFQNYSSEYIIETTSASIIDAQVSVHGHILCYVDITEIILSISMRI